MKTIREMCKLVIRTFFFLFITFCLMGCKNTQKKDIISLVPDSNFIVTSINTLDSIVISYESLFRDKCKVKRVFYYKSLLPITIEYNLIDKGSKVSLELQNPNERCDYLIFDKFKKVKLSFQMLVNILQVNYIISVRKPFGTTIKTASIHYQYFMATTLDLTIGVIVYISYLIIVYV